MTQRIPASSLFSSHIDAKRYKQLYRQSLENPEGFWAEMALRLDWMRPFTRVKQTSFHPPVSIRWYEDGLLNVSTNCLDRHLPLRANQVAIIWQGDSHHEVRKITYKELHTAVCRMSNVLKAHGVKKGDRVTIYLPMIPEAAIAMLACARIGAIHSVVFGGFSSESLKNRLLDCKSTLLITSDEGIRGGKRIPMKENADAALSACPEVKNVLVIRRTGAKVPMHGGRDFDYEEEAAKVSAECPAEPMGAEDPLFILYTSGSTGKPKGVLHTTGGYLVYASLTHEWIFDYQPGEVYWCTADVGWITGHSYIVYGPLANGATTLMFEGIPNWPDASRVWRIIDQHQVNSFYTAPTLIRALMREGESPVKQTSRKSLRLLGSVGEPINPEAWLWYWRVVGDERCPVVDTWWQTETGGILISPLPGAIDLKPGSATLPFFGIRPEMVTPEGKIIQGEGKGDLVLLDSWPGQMRTLYGDHKRFEETYFKTYPGTYYTGDRAERDDEGYWWILGRADDVLNVSGHRIGSAEIESALVAHPAVAEAAVIGLPHEIKGQGICAYVTLMAGVEESEALKKDLIDWVKKEIGGIAAPDWIFWAPALPKTRSGKIMRRILRKIAEGDLEHLGDISTLADPSVISKLAHSRVRD